MSLLRDILACTRCIHLLPLEPRPILQYSSQSSIIIIGQAPGIKAHESGIPWNDASGERLRSWLGIDATTFYDKKKVALIPMGFCYPGRGKSGDNPPIPGCAAHWHHQLLAPLKNKKLIILIGSYAQDHYLGQTKEPTLTETIKGYRYYLPQYFVLPHPSPRNNIWLKKNKWFEDEVLTALKEKVAEALS